jgi:molybdenum cofactor cytidylyltransferase/nicotine blue oxidoreductase
LVELPRIRALVLAAGEGRRFGGAKQLAEAGGRPILERVLELAEPYDPLVVLGAHAPAILERLRLPCDRVVLCDGWQEGQAASLRAGVVALGPVEAALVLLGDQPFLTPAVVEGTLERWDPTVCDAVRPSFDGVPGHPVLLGRPVLDAVCTLRGDTGARALLEGFRVRTWEAGGLGDPTDIDTPAQLEV